MANLRFNKEITALLVIDLQMHAALDVNIPNYASAIVTTNEIVASISSL
jgi:hypothetical protein